MQYRVRAARVGQGHLPALGAAWAPLGASACCVARRRDGAPAGSAGAPGAVAVHVEHTRWQGCGAAAGLHGVHVLWATEPNTRRMVEHMVTRAHVERAVRGSWQGCGAAVGLHGGHLLWEARRAPGPWLNRRSYAWWGMRPLHLWLVCKLAALVAGAGHGLALPAPS